MLIADELARLKFTNPGPSGVFGCMIGSHDIVHEIGGEDDTNSNTTRRVLLLLESLPIGNSEAYDRVRRQILSRYLHDDRGLVRSGGGLKVPRFLLNDVTRYWRTVTVDFVYKQRSEAGKKWALRNAKLRMLRWYSPRDYCAAFSVISIPTQRLHVTLFADPNMM